MTWSESAKSSVLCENSLVDNTRSNGEIFHFTAGPVGAEAGAFADSEEPA